MAKGGVENSNVKEQELGLPGAKKRRFKKSTPIKERSSGFIFSCDTEMMGECFHYYVFGLPAEKKEAVEKIKEGTKLFLFDPNTKLLHGVFRATCQGQMNLEHSAFGGRFPAQVRFAIHRHCIPASESVFKKAIEENYRGDEFDPELSAKQVRRLIPLLRWYSATAPDATLYPHLVGPPPPSEPYWQFQHSHPVDITPKIEPPLPPSVMPPPSVDPYLSQFQYSQNVNLTPNLEPLPYFVNPPPPVDPYSSQFLYSQNVNVLPKVETRLHPSLGPPPLPLDPHLSQSQSSQNVNVVPRLEPPLYYGPPPPVDPYPSQFPYSHNVAPRIELAPPPVDPYISQFQNSLHTCVVPKVEPPLPHLVRPALDPYLWRVQYSHPGGLVPRFHPPLPVSQHEIYANAGTVAQSIDHQGLPTHLNGQHHVVKNGHPLLPEGSNQDCHPSNPSSSHPGENEDEDKTSDSDDGSFDNLTPQHNFGTSGENEISSYSAVGKDQHNLENVDGKLSIKDVSTQGGIMKSSQSNNVIHAAHSMPWSRSLADKDSELVEATVAKYLNYQTGAVPNNTYLPTATSYHSYPYNPPPHAQPLVYPPPSTVPGRVEPPTDVVSAPVSSLYFYMGPNEDGCHTNVNEYMFMLPISHLCFIQK